MLLQSLTLENFRNFKKYTIEFDKTLNVISGLNGSGKTSLLEAIYYLSRGKSFRSSSIANIIYHQQGELMLQAVLTDGDIDIPVGIIKNKLGKKTIRLNSKDKKTFKEITEALPVLLLDTDTHRQLASGSKYRRAIVDWGCFYHYPDFSNIWRDYNKVLAQRNFSLKSGYEVNIWNDLLVDKAYKLNKYRKLYCADLIVAFKHFWNIFASNLDDVDCDFLCGWDDDIGLVECLDSSIKHDLRLGYTKFGPHRMDLNFNINKDSAFHILSQGQQKIMSYALVLAQGKLLREIKNISCIYLIDDLSAELDVVRIRSILEALVNIDSQIILTAIDNEVVSQIVNYKFKQIILS